MALVVAACAAVLELVPALAFGLEMDPELELRLPRLNPLGPGGEGLGEGEEALLEAEPPPTRRRWQSGSAADGSDGSARMVAASGCGWRRPARRETRPAEALSKTRTTGRGARSGGVYGGGCGAETGAARLDKGCGRPAAAGAESGGLLPALSAAAAAAASRPDGGGWGHWGAADDAAEPPETWHGDVSQSIPQGRGEEENGNFWAVSEGRRGVLSGQQGPG